MQIKVLIVGKKSYIGINLKKWLEQYPELFFVNSISSRDYLWKNEDFTQYHVVVNCAGIAHINHITEGMRDLFYSVNRDLPIELGKWAKNHGVKYFVNFSSMNVYGDYCNNITDRTKVNPRSFYGDSKLQGDLGLQKLEDENFHVAHVRPPFVYGKGCSGNYNVISKIAKKIQVFPTYRNKKSMIYIDNLCEFIRLLIKDEKSGIFTPQNKELVSTADLVDEIARANGKHVWFTGLFNWMIPFAIKIFKPARKAFANDNYVLKLSDYYNNSYCIVNFKQSISISEK